MRYRRIIILAVVALIAGALGVSAASAAAPNPTPPVPNVMVTNPLDKPVPVSVTNTVAVTNASCDVLQVSVKDAPAVKIDSTANAVQVVNPYASPVNTREVGTKQPVSLELQIDSVPPKPVMVGQFRNPDGSLYTIPVGKILVITGIDGVAGMEAGETARFGYAMLTFDGGAPNHDYRLILPMEPLSEGSYVATRDCELYVSGDTWISGLISLTDTPQVGVHTTIRISGYLADAP